MPLPAMKIELRFLSVIIRSNVCLILYGVSFFMFVFMRSIGEVFEEVGELFSCEY